MNREQLRALILADAVKLQNSMAWRWLSATDKRLSRSAASFWSEDNPVTNAALDALASIYNAMG